MPRVTNKEQYRRHKFLRMLWYEPELQTFFPLLSINEQFEIHTYYATGRDLTESEFKNHLDEIDSKFPSLCHKAGKHFKYLEKVFMMASKAFGADQKQIHQAISACATHRYASLKNIKPNRTNTRKNKTDSQKHPASSRVTVVPYVRPDIDFEKLANAFLMLAEQITKQKNKDKTATGNDAHEDTTKKHTTSG